MMSQQLSPQLQTLLAIGEMRRIYSSIESFLSNLTPACVAVTSAVAGEGKSVAVAGLAAVGAQQTGKRTLLIDLNWHAPCLHRLLGVEPGSGTAPMELAERVQHTALENLDVVAAPGNGACGAADDTAAGIDLIRQARNTYDCIFVDTSKLFPTNRNMIDPVAIAKTVDGVIVTVLANATPRQQVKRATKMLETAGANLLGVIVNQWQNPFV